MIPLSVKLTEALCMLTTSYQIDMTVKISRVVIGKEDNNMKKAVAIILNLLCGCLCAFGAGLWFNDAVNIFIEEK